MATPAPHQELIVVGNTRVGNAYGLPKDATFLLERNVFATMRDGARLATNVFRPVAPGRYPVLMHMAHTGKDRYPGDQVYQRIQDSGGIVVSEWAGFEAQDPVYWVPNGYVVVVADCRATWDSDGDYFDFMCPQIGRDYHDLIEWAAVQEWSNGNIGTNGVSYLAMTQWWGAAEQPPHLKAFVPWEGSNDIYREWAFNGGIPDTGFYRIYMRRYMMRKGQKINEAGWRGGETDDMIAKQSEHPLDDEFWRNKHPDLTRINVPAYIAGSWSSDLHIQGALEGYRQIASQEKWLEIHARKEWEYYYSREVVERQRRFLDYFLKGKHDSGIMETPRVRFEVRERFFEGRVKFAGDFPIPGTEYRKLYLDFPTATLMPTPTAKASIFRYRALQSATECDSAQLSVTFRERTELVGYMKLRLWVSADGADDMDLHIGLKKFDKYGNEVTLMDFDHCEKGMVASGRLRVSHRELDEQKSTPYRPWHKHQRLQPLSPGELVPVDIAILPSGTAFNPGEQLRLIIQGYDVLRYHYRHQHDETVNQGYHALHSGGEYDSHLLVPVIPV